MDGTNNMNLVEIPDGKYRKKRTDYEVMGEEEDADFEKKNP